MSGRGVRLLFGLGVGVGDVIGFSIETAWVRWVTALAVMVIGGHIVSGLLVGARGEEVDR